MTKKPYYKLTIGRKPYTSADLKFDVGRVKIEVSDAHPDATALLTSFVDVRWDKVCRKVLEYWNTAPPTSLADATSGGGVRLQEPDDLPLRVLVARMDESLRRTKKAKETPGAP